MAGDLLRVTKDVCLKKGTIVEVRGIDADNRLPEKGLVGSVSCVAVDDPDRKSGGIWCEYLEPIPITPEILKKNGFAYYNYGHNNYGWKVNESESVVLGEPKDGIFPVGCVCPDLESYYLLSMFGIKYIHELQHVFKNCSINHTIKL